MPKIVRALHIGGGPLFFSRGGRMVKMEKGAREEMPEAVYQRNMGKLQLIDDGPPTITADVKRSETAKRKPGKWTLAMSPQDYLDRFGDTADPSATVAARLELARSLTDEDSAD